MIIERLVFQVKPAHHSDAAELLMKEREQSKDPSKMRILNYYIGPFNTIVAEIEFEDMEEHVKYWDEWLEKPETAEFWEKWNQYVDPGGQREIWTVLA